MAWNPSSSLTIYFSILPLCGRQLPLRKTFIFILTLGKWQNAFDNMCLWKFLFSSGNLSSLTCDLGSLSLWNRADSLATTSVPSKVRNCAEPPEHLRSEISSLRTCNIPNLISYVHRIAPSKRFTGCVSTISMVVKLHAHWNKHLLIAKCSYRGHYTDGDNFTNLCKHSHEWNKRQIWSNNSRNLRYCCSSRRATQNMSATRNSPTIGINYKPTCPSAISSHCLTVLPAKMSAFNTGSYTRQNAYHHDQCCQMVVT